MKYSCIIPVYNEQSRVVNVLEAVVAVKEISEIICVDDGSVDNSYQMVKEKFPKIKLLHHARNLGKTATILTGLKSAKQDSILLLDSDLKDLQSAEFAKAISVFERNKLDCLLLHTAPMDRVNQLLRIFFRNFLLLATGNRIIRRQYLKDSLTQKNLKSYHVEIAQNRYFMEHHKNVGYFEVSAKDVSKIEKEGWIKGLPEEIKMWQQIINYAGLIFFLKQSLFFTPRKVS